MDMPLDDLWGRNGDKWDIGHPSADVSKLAARTKREENKETGEHGTGSLTAGPLGNHSFLEPESSGSG